VPRRSALLLLGGLAVAWNQRFLHAAQARDLTVLLLDEPSPHAGALLDGWPGSEHPLAAVDEVGLVPARDLADIVERCAAWARSYRIRGVCSLREDYVEPAAVLADLWGLPSPGLRAARVCRNKYLQRRYLAAWSPASTLIEADRRDAVSSGWTAFPAVVKPVGRSASSGVRRVTGPADLRRSLADYPPGETLVIEERVDGPEYSVESLSHQGTVRHVGVTRKRTTERDSAYFVEMGHTTPPPGIGDGERAELERTHAAVLDRLGLDTGIAHAEYRLTQAGQAALMEVAVRPPGDSIMALHWLASGAPLEDAVIGLAVGEDVSYPRYRRFARQVYLDHRPGVLEDLTIPSRLGVAPAWFHPAEVRAQVSSCGAADAPPTLRCVVGLKPVGSELPPLRESGDRAAMFVVDAATARELDEMEAYCRDAITLRLRDGVER
jgi:ATP-grasp domain